MEIKTDIREYGEEMAVEIDERDGRKIVRAYNQAGFDSVAIDLLDVLKFVKKEMPDLLEQI